jgi:DNA-binding LytR/AlgR family response regulator
MSDKLRCIISDDEPLARKGMQLFAAKVPFLEVVAQCGNAVDTITAIKQYKPDFIFLDINMPDISGMELLKSLEIKPLTIINSAFPEYALEAYELDVIDYLVKPVSFARFLKAVNKVSDYLLGYNESPQGNKDYFFVKSGHKFEKICFNEIIYIEAMQNYVIIHTDRKKIISYLTMKGIQEFLPDEFKKINKSNIISSTRIETISADEITVAGIKLTVSKNYKNEIAKYIDRYVIRRKL